jgi:hypothetical protein
MSNFVTFKVQMLFYFNCSKLIKFNSEPPATPASTVRHDHVATPMCGAAEGSLVSPLCQRGGPAAPLHVARQSGPAAPRALVRANTLDLQIKFR